MKTLKRTSITERATEEIKRYLLSGDLKPGDKLLTEAELAAQLGVGRSTVREAIRTLQAMGYVELRPGRGAFAVITSPDDELSMRENAIRYFKGNQGSLSDFLEVRILIEPYAASLAATRADHEARETLQNILVRFADAAKHQPDHAELARLELEFHSTIVEASGNKLLASIFRQLCRVFAIYSENSFTAYDSLEATMLEHARIVEAVLAHDSDAAEREMRTHISISSENMKNAIRE